jgi:phage protein D
MSDPGTTPAFYAARSEIKLDEELEPQLSERLLSLLVEETSAGLFRCEATFGNWGAVGGGVGYLYLDRQLFDFGKSLSVTMGDGEASREIFNGRIMGLEAQFPQTRPAEITILAEDRFQDLRMTRRTRAFEDVSDQDVIEEVARQHSLRTDLDINGPTYPVLTQVNQSDLAFLRERARAIDAELWIEGDTLFVQARSRRNHGDVTLTYQQGLREISILADLACQRTSLSVSGWDVSTKEGIVHKAEENILGAELNGFNGGATILQQAFGQRPEHIVHTVPFSPQEARVQAEARFRMMARQFVCGRGEADGDGRIRVGAYLDLNLQEPNVMFDGKYYVTEVRHTFDQINGFRTQFRVERPGIT